jgi:predicted XRE-type DNA-binding protein
MNDKNKFASVWDAIEDTPQEAASMKARSALMMELSTAIQERGMTQAAAAALFGVTQPRISDLMRGKVNLFSLDTLIDMASTAGMAPMVKITKLKAPTRRRALPRQLVAA